ncbi:MAG TPA: LiaF domain-containing protein [Cytophagales bacterium]|nr:LiaF domain-containing protein [Cytophagales bacterium]
MFRKHRIQFQIIEERQKHKKRAFLFWGIALVLGGLALLARNLDLIAFDIPTGLLSWKLIFIVMAINLALHTRYIGAVMMSLLALVFYTPEIVGQDLWEYKKKLWPIIPILIGLLFLIKMNKKKSDCDLNQCSVMEDKTLPQHELLEETLILSGGNKKISSYDFKGGRITTVMAGLEVDLTNCTLSNNRAVIEIVSVMGGVSLTVPREWNVKLDIVPVLGGVDDRIFNTPQAYVDPAAELIIKGTIVMGGVEINRA